MLRRLRTSCPPPSTTHTVSHSHLVHEAELGQLDGDTVDESAGAGSQEDGSDQGGGAPGHVHHTGAGEVEDAAVHEELRLPVPEFHLFFSSGKELMESQDHYPSEIMLNRKTVYSKPLLHK